MSKKFKKFILHVGGDKTGSTAIQRTLSHNKNKLLTESGLLYPLHGWHAELGSYFSSAPESYVLNRGLGESNVEKIKNRDEKYFEMFQSDLETANRAHTLAVSYEGFLSASSDILSGLKKYALQIAEELLVVVYLRPPISYALSAMSQHVKCGRRPYPAGSPPYTPYAKILKHIVNIFGEGNVCARKFDRRTLINGSVVDDFLSICGVSEGVYMALDNVSDSANTSLTYEGLVFGDEVIKEMEKRNMAEVYSTFEFQRKIGQFFSEIPGQKFRISEIDSDAITSKFESDFKYIQNEFGLDLLEKYHIDDGPIYEPDMENNTAYPYAKVLVDVIEQTLLLEDVDMQVVADIESIKVAAGEDFNFQVRLFNKSTSSLYTKSRYPLKVVYLIRRHGDDTILAKGNRTDIPCFHIKRKSQVKVDMTLTAPLEPGEYRVTITLVQEHNAWLHDRGLEPAIIKLYVN